MTVVRPRAAIGLVVVVAAVAAACAAPSGDVNKPIVSLLSPTTTSTIAPVTTSTTVKPCDPTVSGPRSAGPLPQPGAMPTGSYMATIQERGRLRVGVDQATLLFGYRNPQTGDLEGLDIALAQEIARAIFGDPTKIEPVAVTTSQRLPVVEHQQVDLVASQITATCSRRQDVDLSTIYYMAYQKVLVRKDGPISTLADLKGKRVCATAGSTSIANIARVVPGVVSYPVASRADCLVALEEGAVDAITSDDTILLGFEHQDPNNTYILPNELEDEPYALATSKAHPDFGQFVNGVLDELRTNGRLEQLYQQYLDVDGFHPPASPPPAEYSPGA